MVIIFGVLNHSAMTPVIPQHAQQLLDKQAQIDAKLDELHVIISKARRGQMGLTLDADKTPEWREAKRLYAIHWDAYRKVNQQLTKIRKCIGYEAINGKRVCIYQY